MKQAVREKARQLRLEGMSVRDIAKELSVSRGSVSVWVRDIQLTDEQKEQLKANQKQWAAQNNGAQTNRQLGLVRRSAFQQEGREKAKEMRPLHLAGCMLYWAEGGKIRNRLYFANSDPNMHLLFMRFLREEMGVSREEITIYIHCHTSDPDAIRQLEDYWVNLLGLSRSNLRKTYTKKGSKIKRSILEHGVCGVGVHSTKIVQHIYGAIQEYGGFENPEWLF